MNMEFKTQIPRDTRAIDSLLLANTHTKGVHLQQESHSSRTAADPRDADRPEQGEARKTVIKMKVTQSEDF